MITRKLTKPLLRAYDSRSSLLSRFLVSQFPSNARDENKVAKSKSTVDDDDDDISKPIVYSQTKAATYKAATFYETVQDFPDCQNVVVAGSLTVFMIYFFVLREGNDIDELLDRHLTETLYSGEGNK